MPAPSQQHYAGDARWDAIADLKAHVTSIPVLGNGDIWEATDAIAMMAATGCDGVVVGRGCLGRPWLFGDLLEVFAGRPAPPSRRLGEASAVMVDHARALVVHHGDERSAMRAFRKHASWYLTGYPVGGDARRRFAQVSTCAELDDLVAELDPSSSVVPGGERIRRGHTNGPIKVSLPTASSTTSTRWSTTSPCPTMPTSWPSPAADDDEPSAPRPGTLEAWRRPGSTRWWPGSAGRSVGRSSSASPGPTDPRCASGCIVPTPSRGSNPGARSPASTATPRCSSAG